jgi:hypothetical protein
MNTTRIGADSGGAQEFFSFQFKKLTSFADSQVLH